MKYHYYYQQIKFDLHQKNKYKINKSNKISIKFILFFVNLVMKGSLLRDDPDPICWSRVGSNVLSFGIASGILAGIGLRSAFLLKKHSITPSVLHKLPANSSSIIFGVLTGAVGGLYGFNREMVKIIQPNRPVAPLYVQQLKDDLVTIPKVHSSFSPRSQIAYQLILQDLFKHEVCIVRI